MNIAGLLFLLTSPTGPLIVAWLGYITGGAGIIISLYNLAKAIKENTNF